jgi:hypothetical protein
MQPNISHDFPTGSFVSCVQLRYALSRTWGPMGSYGVLPGHHGVVALQFLPQRALLQQGPSTSLLAQAMRGQGRCRGRCQGCLKSTSKMEHDGTGKCPEISVSKHVKKHNILHELLHPFSLHCSMQRKTRTMDHVQSCP